MNFKKKAKDILKAYPEKERVYITGDGQAFFTKGDATTHATDIAGNDITVAINTKEPYKVFFRNGNESDTTNAETLEEVQNALAERAQVIEDIDKVLKGELLDLSPESDATLAEVVKMKEASDSLTNENEELKETVATLHEVSLELTKERDGFEMQLKAVVLPEASQPSVTEDTPVKSKTTTRKK